MRSLRQLRDGMHLEIARRYLEQAYADDPDCNADRVIAYYDLDDQHRLDVAGVDGDDDVRVAVEVERVNNDLSRAVPEDFDKIAACDVDEAIWVVMTRDAAPKGVDALSDPPDGSQRVEKTYSRNTPPRQFTFETDGITEMYSVLHMRDKLLDDG